MDQDTTWNEGEEEQRHPTEDRKKRISESHDEVFRMWEAGVRDLQEIASETGYTPAYVRLLLGRRGYEVTTVNVHSNEDIAGICKDYTEGMKIYTLLRKWKLSNNSLYAILEERKVPIRKNDESRKAGRKRFIDRAIEMYQDEYPIKEIHAETGVTASTLYQELADRGINIRSQITVTNEMLDKAVELYGQRQPTTNIEEQTGVTPGRLYRELDVRGIIKHRGQGLPERLNKAVEMFQQGKLLSEIYIETRVGSTMLYRVLRRRGLEKRRGRARGEEVIALDLYDKGAPAREILSRAKMTIGELTAILSKRGKPLRTGLPGRLSKKGLDLAVEMYAKNLPIEDIEIETLTPRVQLFAELKNRKMEIRP